MIHIGSRTDVWRISLGISVVVLVFLMSASAEESPCRDEQTALKMAQDQGLNPLAVVRDFDAEQSLIHAQVDIGPSLIGTPVRIYCAYDVKTSGFKIENGRISAMIVVLHETPTYLICDSQCSKAYFISDSTEGLRQVNVLLKKIFPEQAVRKSAVRIAELSLRLIKRIPVDSQVLRLKDVKTGYVVSTKWGSRRYSIVVHSSPLAVDFAAE
jgi:hypothetical protein